MNKRFYQHLGKHYSKYSMLANTLVALAMAGFALLGVLNTALTLMMLVTWGGVFACLYAVGKLLDQEVDDLDKINGHMRYEDNGTPECCERKAADDCVDGDDDPSG